MRKNSTIKERILEYLALKGVSEYSFYKKTGISRGTLQNDSGLSQKNTSKFFEYAPDANPDYFLFNKGNILKDVSDKSVKGENTLITKSENTLSQTKEESIQYKKNIVPKLVTVDHHGEENIVMVPAKARAGYTTGYGDPEFLSTLPTFRLPKMNNGTFRMFEVEGHSMYPTIHQGAYAVGEWVEDWLGIQDNNIYIVVTKDDGVVIKRVLNRIEKYNNLYLKSDNRKEYPSYSIDPSIIIEIWKLKTALVFEFQDPASLYDRVNDLEAEINYLKTKV